MCIVTRSARRGYALWILLALWLAPLARAQEPAPPEKIVSIEGITEYRLHNGMKVLLFPDNSRPTITTALTVFVGSRHEGYGETGMAHLLEHMLFKGTPTYPRVDKVLRERGATYNGTTNDDRTNYFETLPASDENLEFAIAFEADRLVNCFVRREDLLTEMTVVRNEFERGENSPSRILSQRMSGVAYEWHNYGKSTIGNRSDIERVPIENLQDFYKKYYQPDNAMLVVAGQFEEAKALQYVQKYFGALPRPTRKLPHTYTEEPTQDGERSVTLRRAGEVGLVGAVYHICSGAHEDFAPLYVLGEVLADAPSGPLYKALVETKKATSVAAGAYGRREPSLIEFEAEVRKDGSLEEVRDILLDIVESAGQRDYTEEEVQRVKLRFRNATRQALNNPAQFAVALSNWAAQGDWRLYFVHRDRVEKVTPADVRRVAAQYLKRSNRTVGLFIPTAEADRTTIPPAPDVQQLVANYKSSQSVSSGEAFQLTFENIEARTKRQTLPDGVKVSLLPKKTRGETVTLMLTLRYGSLENLKDVYPAASFLPTLMTRGTKNLSRQQLQDELARLEARLTGGAGFGGRGGAAGNPGTASFLLSARRETFVPALELLRQVLREPALSDEEFETMKRARLAGLEEQKSDPASLAAILLSRQLSAFEKGDLRYVKTIEEEIAEVQSVTAEQVRKLYAEYLGAAAGELAIVGDFDPEAAMAVLGRTFSGWHAPQGYARFPEPPTKSYPAGKETIRTPDKANATYVAGLVLPMSDEHEDYAALVIANYILGRGPGSRLWDRVREREGLSYGVGSSLNTSAEYVRSVLSFNAICNPENIGKVEASIADELARLLRDGIPREELERAKSSYVQQQRLGLAQDAAIAAALNAASFRNRTLAFNAALEKKIAALTPEQVVAAARKHIDPKKLAVVVAGDFK